MAQAGMKRPFRPSHGADVQMDRLADRVVAEVGLGG